MDGCEIRKSKRTKKQISCNEDLEVDGFSGSRQENGEGVSAAHSKFTTKKGLMWAKHITKMSNYIAIFH